MGVVAMLAVASWAIAADDGRSNRTFYDGSGRTFRLLRLRLLLAGKPRPADPVMAATALSNRSQSITNRVSCRLQDQKRKLENFEQRLRGETRAFRPANEN